MDINFNDPEIRQALALAAAEFVVDVTNIKNEYTTKMRTRLADVAKKYSFEKLDIDPDRFAQSVIGALAMAEQMTQHMQQGGECGCERCQENEELDPTPAPAKSAVN